VASHEADTQLPPVAPRAHAGAICLACGYGIAGLPRDARCPECGSSIARSLLGGTLEAAHPDYIATLRRGALLAMLGFGADLVYLILFPLLMVAGDAKTLGLTMESALLLALMVDVASAGIGLVGWWMLTAPDPAQHALKTDVAARRLLRGLLIFIAIVTLVGLVVRLVPALAGSGLGAISGNLQITPATVWSASFIAAVAIRGASFLAKLARFFVGLWYLRSLAAKIPSAALRARASRSLWLLPLCFTIGWVLFFVGPLYGIWYYLRTLGLFRREFRLVLERIALANALPAREGLPSPSTPSMP
jgi:hypothetical protein